MDIPVVVAQWQWEGMDNGTDVRVAQCAQWVAQCVAQCVALGIRHRRTVGITVPVMTYELILLRHGESEWNAKNLFTGWVDVDLNDKGRGEAVHGGELLRDAGLLPDVVHTSLLRRAITTAHLSLDAADRHWIPVRRSWRLNERHYGGAPGQEQEADAGGVRRGAVHALAPVLRRAAAAASRTTTSSPRSGDPRYADLGDEMPRTECLKDVIARMLPYWDSDITADLRAGHRVLVAAHGNSLRAIVKHLDGISDEDIAGLNIPTGMPLLYRLDEYLRPTVAGGEYLDPEAAAAAAAAVANQGRYQLVAS